MNVSALLLVSSSCPHCPAVMQALTELLKEQKLSRLEIVNIEAEPELAGSLGVRSVPWVKIGEFELAGAHSKAELAQWVQRSGEDAGVLDFLSAQLESGQISEVTDFLTRHAHHFDKLLTLLADADAKINLRIGVSAVVELLEGSPLLAANVTTLAKYSAHESPALRADVCHFLSLTHSAEAIPVLEDRLEDYDGSVREIVAESLEALRES